MPLALQIILIVIASIIGAILAVSIIITLLFLLVALFTNPKKTYLKPNKFCKWVLIAMHRIIFVLGNIRVKVDGKDKLPEGRFLLVSNHRSVYDPLCTWLAFSKTEIAFVSKEENLTKPLIGRWGIRTGCMAIDREDARKAVKTIVTAADRISNDVISIGIYPEGTRSTGANLLEFHNAVFKIAQRAKVPIVVITVDGTEKIKKRFFFKRTNVSLKVVDVIPVDFVTENGTKEIGDRVREKMLESLSE